MIYLDHAATTPLDKEVFEAMKPYLETEFGNASMIYSLGRKARQAIEEARGKTAEFLGCEPGEVVFTSGGTESCNLAILGTAKSTDKKHIVTTQVEHSSVLRPCEYLQSQGYQVTYIKPDSQGFVTAEQVKDAITADTFLVSIIYANNEVGTINNISEIAQVCKEADVLLHTDACQAVGVIDINVKNLNVDLMTINGSKIYGPKGAGLLFVKSGTKIAPIILGGGQEFGLRSGTESIAAIVGLAKALELAITSKQAESKRLTELRDHMIGRMTSEIEGTTLNGSKDSRLPQNINLSIDGIEGESLLLRLDKRDIYISTGSACASIDASPSHVLTAMGKTKNEAHSSIRISLGRSNTKEEIDSAVDEIKNVVEEMREIFT